MRAPCATATTTGGSVSGSVSAKTSYVVAGENPGSKLAAEIVSPPSSLYKPFDRARAVIGHPDLRWHDLRHTATTRMVEGGLAPMIVMKLTGHSQMGTFARYVNANDDAATKGAEALDDGGHHHDGALASESARDAFTHSLTGSGHDGHSVVQAIHIHSPPSHTTVCPVTCAAAPLHNQVTVFDGSTAPVIARGAMGDLAGGKPPRNLHRFYHVPASNTAVGHLILEEQQ